MKALRNTSPDSWVARVAGTFSGLALGAVGGWVLGYLVWLIVGAPKGDLNMTPLVYGFGGALVGGSIVAALACRSIAGRTRERHVHSRTRDLDG